MSDDPYLYIGVPFLIPGLVGYIKHPTVQAEDGWVCMDPWYTIKMSGKPIGMFHCPYCGEMVLAGIVHPDYYDPWVDD